MRKIWPIFLIFEDLDFLIFGHGNPGRCATTKLTISWGLKCVFPKLLDDFTGKAKVCDHM